MLITLPLPHSPLSPIQVTAPVPYSSISFLLHFEFVNEALLS